MKGKSFGIEEGDEMSGRTSDSCGPFWLLERICRLIAKRNGINFEIRFLCQDWFQGIFYRPKLNTAIKMLRDFRAFRECNHVSRVHVRLMFYVFRDNSVDFNKPYGFERVLGEYAEANGLATWNYGHRLTIDKPPDQYTDVFVDTWLRLEPALKLLEYLRSCDLGRFGERVELRMMVEVAPWRDTRSEENGCCAIWLLKR